MEMSTKLPGLQTSVTGSAHTSRGLPSIRVAGADSSTGGALAAAVGVTFDDELVAGGGEPAPRPGPSVAGGQHQRTRTRSSLAPPLQPDQTRAVDNPAQRRAARWLGCRPR